MTPSLLICTDLDGTLIPDGSAVESPGVRERFARLAARPQIAVAYVTGRHRGLVDEAIEDLSLPRPEFVIGDVGATVYDLRRGDWRPVERWRQMLARTWPPGTIAKLRDALSGLRDLETQEESKQHEFKLSYYVAAASSAQTLAAVSTCLQSVEIPVRLVFSRDRLGTGLLDLLPPPAGKLGAVEFLAGRLKLPVDRVLFAGDSGNDLEVLASRVPSVLVANARAEVRQRAVALAEESGNSQFLYLARGGLLGMNGNYAAGVLAGFAHFFPRSVEWTQ